MVPPNIITKQIVLKPACRVLQALFWTTLYLAASKGVTKISELFYFSSSPKIWLIIHKDTQYRVCSDLRSFSCHLLHHKRPICPSTVCFSCTTIYCADRLVSKCLVVLMWQFNCCSIFARVMFGSAVFVWRPCIQVCHCHFPGKSGNPDVGVHDGHGTIKNSRQG